MTHALLGRRKRLALILTTAVAALGATAGTASAVTTTTFSNSGVIGIPEMGSASPYPSTINVTGMAGNVQKTTVTLQNFFHDYPDDIAVLLVGPTGANSILMGKDNGGTASTGPFDVTFDQSAASTVPDPLVAGTFKPTSDTAPAPFTAPAPGGPTYPVDLNQFVGKTGNGAWKLFIHDESAGDAGVVADGWSLKITGPFNTITLGTPTLNKKKGTAQLPVTVADAGQLVLSGNGVKTASASKAVAVGGPGTVNLPVRPKGKKKRKLNDTGKVKVNVNVTFTPTGGTASAPQTTKIKLKKTLKK
jgi:subtilisin-like proprotein convertase family protein